MKIYNIRIWLMEKVMDPHFFRNLFSYRKMWGAFSIYSHKRRSDGKPNISYSSHKKAVKAAVEAEEATVAEVVAATEEQAE